MRIAVVQHRLRLTPSDDASALADAAERAMLRGAEVIVLPDVPSLDADESVRASFAERLDAMPTHCLRPPLTSRAGSDAPDVSVGQDEGPSEALGHVVVLVGDACITPSCLESALAETPSATVLCPGAENELQSESFLELAIALSDSLSGLVIIAECAGAEPGEPGHGGSAIIVLGEVMAEALGDDEVIFADVTAPVARPESPEPLPEIPLLLRQRAAFHAGRKLEVTEYPADIT